MRRSYVAIAVTAALVLLALGLGTWLRLWFLWHFPQVNGDGLVYGDIAKNWLLHGVYGRTDYSAAGATIHPTLIRLPGYPLFLAVCFRIFGVDHYGAVLYLQVAIDLLSALIVSWTARAIAGERAGMWALYLAALCPFTANYVAAPLSETLSIFCIALGCAALVWLQRHPGWKPCLLLALTWSYATLLRPDGALLAVASVLAIILFAKRSFLGSPPLGRARAVRLAFAAGILSVIPFLFWTARNLRTFHVFEPLAPRYATDPGEFAAPGFQRWMKTWAIDFASTSDIYWNVDSATLDVNLLPSRAFDSPAQHDQTAEIFDAYNETTTITPAIDARFNALAAAREQRTSAAQLCGAAAAARAGYVAAPAHRDAEYRAALVAVRPPQCGDGVRNRLRGAESCLSCTGCLGSMADAATRYRAGGGDRALLRAAQPAARNHRGAGGPLHSRSLPHALHPGCRCLCFAHGARSRCGYFRMTV